MHLSRIEISGFRGIKRLSLSFNQLTVLIGENTWGKSSLLDALSIALSPDAKFHNFHFSDFHVDYSLGHTQVSQLQIILKWVEDYPGEHKARRYRAFQPVWVNRGKEDKELYYQISSLRDEDKVTTERNFLDTSGNIIGCKETTKLVKQLMVLHPIVRIRDARQLRIDGEDKFEDVDPALRSDINARIQRRLDNTCRRLMTRPGHVSSEEIKSSIRALRTLVDHYFAFTPHHKASQHEYRHAPVHTQYSPNPLEMLARPEMTKQNKLVLMGLINAYIRARGPVELKRISRPIMTLEDPEGRLHPIILHQAWAFVANMPMQKILTTNSPELASVVPLKSIKKLNREPDQTRVYSLDQHSLSRDELRRVGFHVRLHRPGALYARAWLLVEGETEVWLLNEFAYRCGYNFAAEGVQIIEFAQSGLKPIIKIAKLMGIEWHVVTDGDAAGKKYAETVRHMLGSESDKHRLTVLPDLDIEHFLFNHGYEPLFRKLAKVSTDNPAPPKKIIQKALKHHAKPDVALAMVEFTDSSEIDHIPTLLRWLLKRMIALARAATA
ncbi:ATP-dependent endonuclease (plasmid) [Photobacterium sp. GJ3]|uniref:ATP-dependent endonuclease n=1 Tax=Photobacterium sp. GJ3 TaxID=2829502 RepID=UPI001B8AD327|nr:ATP-dependent endonuclease [Photobacterium sp. GJ3]QUJ70413.1 ATP-dependent endonuclease [Photobacterium sp. GJ3]